MDKKNYMATYMRYCKMPIDELQRQLKVLYRRRYDEHDIEYHEEYRLASRAYITRTKSGSGLIFHLKNFIPVLVLIITLCMLKEKTYEFQIPTNSLQASKVCRS